MAAKPELNIVSNSPGGVPEGLVHKTVDFRYSGRDFRLDLSHALFSSFDIDKGTRLLLKTLARPSLARKARSVLDLGCGVGVIGIALGAARPEAEIHFRDRDALAAAFTLRNARANGLEPASCGTGLTLTGLEGRRFDLIVSNVPAKAGPPVIRDLVLRLPAALNEGGFFALVVVNPIARAVREAVEASGASVLVQETGPGHTVFAGGKGREPPPAADELAVYERGRASYTLESAGYELAGYWGLPEFDTPSYSTVLAAALCEKASAGVPVQSVCLSNPGAGHLALYIRTRFAPSRITLVSRDCLSWAAVRRNLESAGMLPDLAVRNGLEPEEGPAASEDLVVEIPQPVPQWDWITLVWLRASRQTKVGGNLVFVSRPTEAVRFDRKKPAGWTRRFDRKRDGWQGLVYRREA